jgi:hypothetical protein
MMAWLGRHKRIVLGVLIVVIMATAAGAWRLWTASRHAPTMGPSELELDAFVLLEAGDVTAVGQATELIAAQGGRVYDFFPPRVLLAHVAAAADRYLAGHASILAIHRTALDAAALSAAPDAQLAATIWRGMLQRGYRGSLGRAGPPTRVDDELALVDPGRLSEIEPASSSTSPTLEQTSEFMLGSVGLEVFLLESNGSQDRNQEDWTQAQRDKVAEEIVAGANWWLQTASANGRKTPDVSFTFAFHDPWSAAAEVATRYEPISHGWQDAALAIAEVMGNLGFQHSSWITAVRRYLHERRQVRGNDWSVAIFVVNSANDSDGAFADKTFAFAYLNGPCIVLTYDCSTWGVDSMEMVFAHELAHAFGALDEYAQAPFKPGDTSGYLSVANSNSEQGTPTEDSIMRGPQSLMRAYQQHQASAPVRGMLGWRDSDSDGWWDVVGAVHNRLVVTHATPLRMASVAYADPGQRAWTEPWRYNGLPKWANSIGIVHVPVCINQVRSVVYRLDGEPWRATTARDGAFGDSEEGYAFTVEGLTAGKHMVESAVINRWQGEMALGQDSFEVVLEGRTPAPSPTPEEPLATPEPSPTASLPLRTPAPSRTDAVAPTATLAPPTSTATPRPVQRATITLQNGLWDYTGCTDTRISADVPDFQFGSSDLKVGERQKQASLIKFDLSSIPPDAIVESAWLSLFGYGREGRESFDVEIHSVNRAWKEDEATWRIASSGQAWSQPGCEGFPTDRAEMPSGYAIVGTVGWYTWDVRDDVQRMIATPDANAGWLLKQSTKLFGVLSICQSEHRVATLRPRLSVDYHLP